MFPIRFLNAGWSCVVSLPILMMNIISPIKQVWCAGAPVPMALMEQVKEQIGADVCIIFGQTETSPIITQTLLHDPFERKAATMGIPLPHTEVKILHPTTGEIVPGGERGELCCRSYLVMAGYYQIPEKTAETQELRDSCKGQISHQKIPRYVQFVESYPLTASGKVQKFVLRERAIKALGLEDVAKIRTA
jgi:acyl-CoA synthetase (AMP-forming)/AMP-acid ligase II